MISKTIEMYPQSEMAHKWLSISYEQKGNFDAAFKTALKLQEIAGYSPAQLSRLRNGYSSGGLRRFYEELYVDKERAKPGKFDKRREPEAYLGFGERLKAVDCLEDGYTKLGKQLNLSLVQRPPRITMPCAGLTN